MFTRRLKGRNMVKTLVFFVVSALFFFVMATVGTAEDYPDRPIILNVGTNPGLMTGNSAQMFAEVAKKYFPKPQNIMVNFKPGANHAICADYVLKQLRDGYNLVWQGSAFVGKMALDGHRLSFKVEDFIPIGIVGVTPHMLTVNKETSPFKTFEEFLEYAKKNPGKLTYGSAGIGGDSHITLEAFQTRCGIKLTHIPFAGGAPALTALLGGHIDCYAGAASSFGDHIKPGGAIKVLVTFTSNRLPELPDVPTALEKGYDIERIVWNHLAAAKGTPQPILDILEKVYYKTMEDPGMKEFLLKAGSMPVILGPKETEKRVRTEVDLDTEVYKKLGLLK